MCTVIFSSIQVIILGFGKYYIRLVRLKTGMKTGHGRKKLKPQIREKFMTKKGETANDKYMDIL